MILNLFGLREQARIRSTVAGILVLTLLLVSVRDVGGQDDKKRPPDPGEAARTHANRGEWDEAMRLADQVLVKHPQNASAHIARGMVLNARGDYDAAIEAFDQVTELKGRQPERLEARADAFAHRSTSYFRRGDYLEAVDSAYFAILEDGDHALAHNNRARAYIAREEFDKAIRSAGRAIKTDESFAAAWANRGYALARKGNLQRALEELDKAVELNPNLGIAWQRRGATHVARGDLQKATEDLNKGVQLQPRSADALCDRAYLRALKGDRTGAMADLDRAISLRKDFARAHFFKGRAQLDQGQHDAAIRSFDTAIERQEDHAAAWCFRGYAQLAKEQYKQAAADFSKSIELEPEFVMALKGRARARRKLGLRESAKEDLAAVKALTEPSEKKQEQPEPQRFVVQSKPVEPGRLAEAQQAAAEIDRLVAAGYRRHNVTPNPSTTDAQFLRRIYLDITGTIPTYQQTRRFLSSRDENKRSLLIDELLSSDGYASHNFNYWADVLRYTDSLNSNVRGEHYRQWIKQSLAENKPWDKLVHEMISAEGLVWENPATGYLQRDANMPLDNMNNTVRIFLGTRIGCAQCHDHPFDRWTQKEFYQMAAFTWGTKTRTGGDDTRYWEDNPGDRLLAEFEEIEQEEEERRRTYYQFRRLIDANMQIVNDRAGNKIHLPDDYAYDNAKPGEAIPPKTLFGKPAVIASDQAPRQAFADWLTASDNPRFAKTIANRLWKQAFGVGQIEPVDDMTDETVAENPELMAFLESEMIRVEFDMKQFMRMIFNSETYQRQASDAEGAEAESFHFPGPILRRMTAEQLWDSFLTLAVVDPDEYRERPAEVRTDITGVNLTSVSAPDLMQAIHDGRAVDSGNWRRERKYKYKGALLARASELPSPVPAGHFLRMFGQSNRELISASSRTGSVPQVLFMFNGPISHMILEKDSTMYNNVKRTRSIGAGIKVVFRTILSRDPSKEEMELAEQEIEHYGRPGYGNVIWALVNTREFLFIQ